MATYRNDLSVLLNYIGTGGPTVQPGETFEHSGAEVESHLRSGFISPVDGPPTPSARLKHRQPTPSTSS